MGIALVCDLPGCGDVISPEETEKIIDRFGEEKPPAIEIFIDGEQYLLLDDVCGSHRSLFKRMVGDFIATGCDKEQKTDCRRVEKEETTPSEDRKSQPKRREVKIPGGIDLAVVEGEMRKENAADIAVRPSEAFSGDVLDKTVPKDETEKTEPKKAPRSMSGPKPFGKTASRKTPQPAEEKKGQPGTVVAPLDDPKIKLIEPSLAGKIDFSGTTRA